MRPAYIRRDPLMYRALRRIWHDERTKDWLSLAAVAIFIGLLLAWRG